MKHLLLGSSLLRAFLAERFITFVTRVFTDVPMIAILAWDSQISGVMTAFIVVTPIYFALCVGIVFANDLAIKRGVDLTGLETLRELEYHVLEEKRWFSKILQKILRSRKTIFWVGSWFYLDPDYVTLLLRKKEESYFKTFTKITLPSVILSMVVWLGVWWAALEGLRWANWMLDWVL